MKKIRLMSVKEAGEKFLHDELKTAMRPLVAQKIFDREKAVAESEANEQAQSNITETLARFDKELEAALAQFYIVENESWTFRNKNDFARYALDRIKPVVQSALEESYKNGAKEVIEAIPDQSKQYALDPYDGRDGYREVFLDSLKQSLSTKFLKQ